MISSRGVVTNYSCSLIKTLSHAVNSPLMVAPNSGRMPNGLVHAPTESSIQCGTFTAPE